MPNLQELKEYLDNAVSHFEAERFIKDDPIAIPHSFEDPLDQEIIGLYAALLSWGHRKTILSKLSDLCELLSYQPRRFVIRFEMERDAHKLSSFYHRTFQPIDSIWFTNNLSLVLNKYGSLETAFLSFQSHDGSTIENAIQGFSDLLFSIHSDTPARLRKHLARPLSGSACKRLCMYLRWMARPGPVDLGIWKNLDKSSLILPVDTHSGRQARALGMLSRSKNDWKAALELTENCRKLSPTDPCRYDFAFFGIGAYKYPLNNRFTGINEPEIRDAKGS